MAINTNTLEFVQVELDLLRWSGRSLGGLGEFGEEGVVLGVAS